MAVQQRLEIPVLSPARRPVVLRRGCAAAAAAPRRRAGALSAPEPRAASQRRACRARARPAWTRAIPRSTSARFGDWLAEHGQDARAVSVLWDLIALPTLNVPAAEASLALGAFVFRTGLLASADAGDIGFHVGTLAETIGEPAERALADAGVRVPPRLARAGRAPASTAASRCSAAAEEEGFSADAVIVALPHARAAGC